MHSSTKQAAVPVQQVGRVMVHCLIIGAMASIAAVVFELLTQFIEHHTIENVVGMTLESLTTFINSQTLESMVGTVRASWNDQPLPKESWSICLLMLAPAVGGLVGGALVYYCAPGAEGGGIDGAIEAYHQQQGNIHPRIPLIKTITSAITLGTGGSAGAEGPIAQIGAGVGSSIAQMLRLSARERRVLMVAGLAAGVGAVFRAPLAAALFSAEILYREMDMEFEVMVPSMISSITSYSLFTWFMDHILEIEQQTMFAWPSSKLDHPAELVGYTALALVMAIGAACYIRLFKYISKVFQQLPIHPLMKPVLGGLAAGSFVLYSPLVWGPGYRIVDGALQGDIPWSSLLSLAIVKAFTSSFTVGSGQSGGVFGPAIVIGGALAGTVGLGFESMAQSVMTPEIGACVMVGMAGFFAAAANTPISTIMLVSEITGNYDLLVPSMWVCVLTFSLVRGDGLFDKQLSRRTDSPVHLGQMMSEVLAQLTVAEALAVGTKGSWAVKADERLPEIMEIFSRTHHTTFPVVDADGYFIGVLDDQALRQAICDDAVRDVLVAADLVEFAPVLVEGESLHSAMHKMVSTSRDELAVVQANNPQKLVGLLSRRKLVATYDHHMRKAQEHREPATNDWTFTSKGRVLPMYDLYQGLRHLRREEERPKMTDGG